MVQRWPQLIGVKVDKTQQVAYFRDPDEIARILPLTTTTQPVEQEEPP